MLANSHCVARYRRARGVGPQTTNSVSIRAGRRDGQSSSSRHTYRSAFCLQAVMCLRISSTTSPTDRRVCDAANSSDIANSMVIMCVVSATTAPAGSMRLSCHSSDTRVAVLVEACGAAESVAALLYPAAAGRPASADHATGLRVSEALDLLVAIIRTLAACSPAIVAFIATS